MKLGRGEKVGSIDLPPDEELEGVGESFRAISEKLAARSLGRLMAGVTHEVRNPLNAMAIHLELVREHVLRLQRNTRAPVGAVLRLDGPDESTPEVSGAQEHLDVIASEIKRLDEVITGFVRFIRPEELQLHPVNVPLLIAEVIALVEPDARRNGITCRAEAPDALPELRADPALVRQALLNLALNGCQAMSEGGRLTMAARVCASEGCQRGRSDGAMPRDYNHGPHALHLFSLAGRREGHLAILDIEETMSFDIRETRLRNDYQRVRDRVGEG